MFGANFFSEAFFAEGFAGSFTPPASSLILRITGFLSGAWFFGKPSAELVAGSPEAGFDVGTPSGDFETDTPDQEWRTGKPF